ncbi:hypothetical protein [Brevibacterium jeotgali]|uniref:Uncharacterized protein n=1 Tax=Brevibacterium jeotgali TaxID=1262550 RepID=A0A2H1L4U6_9MICO|nr:hypothetical protein [Brevibacterium jeotgali]TWC01483.1 hypothetical protein FB108_0129 [Brevibacterium jeotgali]SMY11912.1 hypothetical protein BJEO58_01504 [Brevibacterium jeotgali]
MPSWRRLAAGPGTLTLLYPTLNIAINLLGLEGASRLPMNAWLWLAIGTAWILTGWLTRTPQPLRTLLFTPLRTLLFTWIAGGSVTAALVVIQLFGSGAPGSRPHRSQSRRSSRCMQQAV